jgi:hypothetical protein
MKVSMAEVGTNSVYKTSKRSSTLWCDAQLQMKAAVPLQEPQRTKSTSAADTKVNCEDLHTGTFRKPVV